MTRLDNTRSLQDAQARFGEVVRRAQVVGPQTVTVRGKNAVVIVAAQPLAGDTGASGQSLVEFLHHSALAEVAVGREIDGGRDLEP